MRLAFCSHNAIKMHSVTFNNYLLTPEYVTLPKIPFGGFNSLEFLTFKRKPVQMASEEVKVQVVYLSGSQSAHVNHLGHGKKYHPGDDLREEPKTLAFYQRLEAQRMIISCACRVT